MRKWIYTTDGIFGTVTTRVDGETIGMESGTELYVASDVDAVLKRQAAAAINGMNAATAISSGQVEQARRLRAESSPEALESERQANAILTERVVELEQALREAKRSHYSCEDCWYSCPKSTDGSCNDSKGDECDCGADEHNAKIDSALMESETK